MVSYGVTASIGLLIIRLMVGLTFIGHGSQKLFGWFNGGGIKGTAGFFESIGIKPGAAMAVMAGLSEVGGGLLLALGFLTPLASLLIIGAMLMAIIKVHGPNGFWSSNGGFEYNLIIIAVAIGIALVGPGAYAIDALIF
ncbi:DoxX family protein [Barrientosiimonas marina]|uniref:DoxX family protein n=1 Tax=Lentibacillus kimchii TaxID=1542911 RepID=A0ABW2US64_9BACI